MATDERDDEDDYFDGPGRDEPAPGLNPVPASGPARLAVRSLLFGGSGAFATTLYLDTHPGVWHAVVTLLCALVSVLLVIRLALYPGNLAPELRPRPAWWLLLGVLAVTTSITRLLGGNVWIIVVMALATTTGAGLYRIKGFAPVGLITAGGAGLALLSGATNSGVLLEGAAAGIAALFGAQAWRRVTLLRELHETRQELAKVAVVDERNRIARDLHDLLGHTLALASVKLELTERCFDKDAPRARRELADARAVVRDSLIEVREVVTGYRRPSLGNQLVSARRLLVAYGIDIRYDGEAEWELPAEVDAVLAWVLRESVTNVVKHSKATTCEITVSIDHGDKPTVSVEITDDGIGRQGTRVGGGLSGMGDRVRELGGSFETHPAEPHGFTVRTVIPITARPNQGSKS
jgi:two-component system sensor histidine kinase DesK